MASLPNKLNYVTIKIRQVQLGSTNTYVDPIFAEPASPPGFGSILTLEGQVNLLSKDYLNMMRTMTGNSLQTRGHLLFKNPIKDTSGTTVTLQIGDQITEIAGETTEFFIHQIRPESPLNGAFLLKYVEFIEDPELREST